MGWEGNAMEARVEDSASSASWSRRWSRSGGESSKSTTPSLLPALDSICRCTVLPSSRFTVRTWRESRCLSKSADRAEDLRCCSSEVEEVNELEGSTIPVWGNERNARP